MKMYPEIRTSSFRVQLPTNISLDDKWVVGLAEIHFPLSFVTNAVESVNTTAQLGPSYLADNKLPNSDRKRKRSAEPAMYQPYTPGEFIVTRQTDEVPPQDEEDDPTFELMAKHQKEYEKWKAENLKLLTALDDCETLKRSEIEKSDMRVQQMFISQQEVIQAKEKRLHR